MANGRQGGPSTSSTSNSTRPSPIPRTNINGSPLSTPTRKPVKPQRKSTTPVHSQRRPYTLPSGRRDTIALKKALAEFLTSSASSSSHSGFGHGNRSGGAFGGAGGVGGAQNGNNKAEVYWSKLKAFLAGKCTKREFDDVAAPILGARG
ncbi:hypothetical protein HK097_004475, partial [Rhizophlyctis rosea]